MKTIVKIFKKALGFLGDVVIFLVFLLPPHQIGVGRTGELVAIIIKFIVIIVSFVFGIIFLAGFLIGRI